MQMLQLEPGYGVVFAGDIVDKGEGSIRALKLVRALHSNPANAGRVHLIIGNRERGCVIDWERWAVGGGRRRLPRRQVGS